MARMVLAAAALLVLGAGVYLFVEVRSKPAAADGSRVANDADRGEKASDSVKPTRRDRPAVAAAIPQPTGAGNASDPVAPELAGDPPEDPTDPKTAAKLDAAMDQANKAYDRMELDEARSFAQKVLKQQPGNSRMLRILVSSACMENDSAEAQKHYALLPGSDRAAMRTRCAKYGITFTEPAGSGNSLPHR
ncbi:MAG: hypothetical protein ABI867_34065 [Kofleriaceae bacterium]